MASRPIDLADRRRARGAILPLFAVGLLAIIAVAGMAIDSSHAFVNHTRVQNAVDAAALSAAKSLFEQGRDTALAIAHGTETFRDHLEGELAEDLEVRFAFSDTLSPFADGGGDPRYVRASVDAHVIPIWFARALPGVGRELAIGATAVSGPMYLSGGEVCDVSPLLVCATSTGDLGDASDELCLAPVSRRGRLRRCRGGTSTGRGGYRVGRTDCSGGDCLRRALAGEHGRCVTLGERLATERPRRIADATRDGLDARFGLYRDGALNASEHPPDLVTASPMLLRDYRAAYAAEAWSDSRGEEERRVLPVAIVDCAGGGDVATVLDFDCYFLTRPVERRGRRAYVYAQRVDSGCQASGKPALGAVATGLADRGPFRIVLHDDPDNAGS